MLLILMSKCHQLFIIFDSTVTPDTAQLLRQTQYSVLRLCKGVSRFSVMLSKHVFLLCGGAAELSTLGFYVFWHNLSTTVAQQ